MDGGQPQSAAVQGNRHAAAGSCIERRLPPFRGPGQLKRALAVPECQHGPWLAAEPDPANHMAADVADVQPSFGIDGDAVRVVELGSRCRAAVA